MRVLIPVTLEIVCAGAREEVTIELEMDAQVVGYTPAEPAGLEHAPVPEEVEVEIRLCDSLRVEEIEVFEAGQVHSIVATGTENKDRYTISSAVVDKVDAVTISSLGGDDRIDLGGEDAVADPAAAAKTINIDSGAGNAGVVNSWTLYMPQARLDAGEESSTGD